MTSVRFTEKGQRYERLFDRIAEARRAHFHLEGAWIAYSLLEEQFVSALRLTGGTANAKGDQIKMLGPKLVELRKRLPDKPALRAAMLESVRLEGRPSRLMHSLAAEAKPWRDLQKEAHALATEGVRVAKAFSSAVMRLKKQHERFK